MAFLVDTGRGGYVLAKNRREALSVATQVAKRFGRPAAVREAVIQAGGVLFHVYPSGSVRHQPVGLKMWWE